MYTSIQLANAIIHRTQLQGKPVNPIGLMKLCILAHSFYLGYTSKPLMQEAVAIVDDLNLPSIQGMYEYFRQSAKKQKSTARNPLSQGFPCFLEPVTDPYVLGLLDRIIEKYPVTDSIKMSSIVTELYKRLTFDAFGVFPNKLIEREFKKIIEAFEGVNNDNRH